MDNPDTQQFLAAFRQVVVDKLLPREAGNCEADTDKILLDLSSFSDITTSNPVNEFMHVEPMTSERTDDINALNIATKNVVSYMAGYLLRRITFCLRCQSKITVASLPENDTSTTLLKAKAY